jgi:integrase/recombinase XerD
MTSSGCTRWVEFYWDCHKSVLRFGDFTEEGLKRWIIGSREAGISPASVNTRITGINAYLRWSGMSYKLQFLKEPERVLPTLGSPELTKLIRHKPRTWSERRLHTLVLTLVDTGARIEELLTLSCADTDLENLLLKLRGKGDKERMVPFSLELRKVLYRYRQHNQHELLFCTRDGGRLMRRNVLRDFKRMCKSIEFAAPPRAIHSLRHTFATNYIRNGGSVFHLQQALGHSTLDMSRRYATLLTEDLQKMQQRVSVLNRLR